MVLLLLLLIIVIIDAIHCLSVAMRITTQNEEQTKEKLFTERKGQEGTLIIKVKFCTYICLHSQKHIAVFPITMLGQNGNLQIVNTRLN